MKRPLIFTIIILLVFGHAGAQGLTLDSCKQLALRNNAAVKNAMLDVSAAKEVKKQAMTKFFPNVSAMAGGYYALNPLVEYGIEDVDNAALRQWLHNLYFEYGASMGVPNKLSLCENGLMAGATAVQPIFMGGQIINGNRLAAVGVEASELQGNLKQEKVLQEVEENYWFVVSLYEKHKTLTQALTFLDSLYRDAENACQAGLITRNDPLKVTLKQNEMRSNLLKVDNGITLATMALCQSIGTDYQTDVHLIDTLDETAILRTVQQLSEPTEASHRKEARLLEMNVNAEHLKKKMTIGETLPHLMVGAGASYGNLIFDNYSANGMAFATLQVPLTNWWETSHKIKQHNYAIQKAENERTDLMEKMVLEMQQTWYGVQEAVEQLKLMKTTLEDAQANLETARVNYQAGLVTISDLLEAQTLYQRSQDQVSEALINLHIKCNQYRLLNEK